MTSPDAQGDVTLEGTAWVDVTALALVTPSGTFPVAATFTDDTHWRLALTLAPGAHPIVLAGLGPHGTTVATASITIQVTP